jgi:hypothetical protein
MTRPSLRHWTHFDIGPCITQSYSPAFFIDIRKSVIDMSKVLEWDFLRWEFTPIDTPVDQLPLIIRRSSPSAYQLTYYQSCRERGMRDIQSTPRSSYYSFLPQSTPESVV